ncbi:NAD(P)/FAD-dependent oxidoreductase [Natronorarus salvus]|uniref:NAD(P)/FAD-dependent oxidoreductase n=1 Tax=Natronorarus salvus TaxID=3117733 RepID=UPI002F262C1E
MRVLVCGAGYAGVTLARRLESRLPDDAELVVIDEHHYHLVQHELHRVIRRPSLATDIAVRLDGLFDRAETREGRVERIDRDRRVVEVDGEELSYDYAAICLGAETATYGLPGVAEHGLPLKRLPDAERIREAVLGVREGGTVVVGGAGLSGVQVAGELAALSREADREFRVLLAEREAEVAPNFPENFRGAVRSELEARDVEVLTDRRLTRATGSSVEFEGRAPIGYDAFVWTGGIRGTDALGGRRPFVRADLRLDDRTFVVGDAARVVDADGQAVPASAQAAIREARVVADGIAALVESSSDGVFAPRTERYTFDSLGWLVSVGDGAVAQVGPTVLTGGAAHALKASVGVGYLSSIGALRTAAELVDEEFGIATEEG